MIEQALEQHICAGGHPMPASVRFCPACGAPPLDPPYGQQARPSAGYAAWPSAEAASWPPFEVPVPEPVPARGSGAVPWGLVTLFVVVALALGVGGGAFGMHVRGRTGHHGIDTAPATTAPDPAPTAIGLVDIAAVRAESRAESVGTVLNEYFSGINDRDIPRVLAVMDPAGVVDRDDPAQVQRFRDELSTTTDTDVAVHWIRADDATGGTQAGVTFTSRQDARYGPDGQTCSRWSLTYVLSSRFLIVRTISSNGPC